MRQTLLCIIGALILLGCERNNVTVTGSTESDDQHQTPVKTLSSGEDYSEDYQFDMDIDYDEIDFGGSHPDGINIQFDATSNDVFALSVPLTVTPVINEDTPGDMEYDVMTAINERIPTNLSYNGNSISYTVNGQNGSENLNTDPK